MPDKRFKIFSFTFLSLCFYFFFLACMKREEPKSFCFPLRASFLMAQPSSILLECYSTLNCTLSLFHKKEESTCVGWLVTGESQFIKIHLSSTLLISTTTFMGYWPYAILSTPHLCKLKSLRFVDSLGILTSKNLTRS